MSATATPAIKIEATTKLDGVGTAHDYKYKTIMTSVETFKTAVIRIRDILRGPGVSITGMDSMRHICLYLLSRYMTRAKVESLEVPEEFAWETLIETAQTKNGGVQKALDCFYHAEEDCLVRHFDRLFGTDKFSFDIKNPQKHKEILEILNAVNMADVDCQMDILGWVYEQHLRTGSSAARDLGQFFTDRFICEYMTKLCKPGFKSAGVPESVCDPSMGTGGFLTAFIKYFKKHHADKPIDWSVQQKEIHGCDTDPKVAGVSRLNLFMETGGNRTTNLLTHDSLYGDLTQTGYDVILANMPFGLKGIKHAECCERVKALKIRGTKSEPLFLQLMMVSLNMGGRCAVVVPDGMLVNSSSCHNDTRKYLLDHFDLKRVIKMKGQFFMNTGIQPSILFFEKTGKPTEAVEFWEVVKGDKGEITETMVVSVPSATIKADASCSLDMRRYLESEKPVANPAGYPIVKLSDISDLYSGKANRDADSGDIPFFASSGSVGKRDKHNFEGKYIITARTQSIGSVSYYDGKLWASDNTILLNVKDETVLTSRFLYYWLMLNKSAIHNIANTGLIPLIRKSDLAEIKMPLPPLPIQQEIVATLDRIYATSTMTTALSSSVQTQMKELFNSSLKSSDYTYPEISSFCSFEKSKIAATKNVAGEYPFISLKTSTHNAKTLDESEHVFISGIPQGNRLMKVKFHKGECAYSSLMFHCKLDTKVILPKFFYNYLRYNMDILNEYVVGVQPKFSHESFLTRKLIVPSLTIQHAVLKHLDIMEQSIETFERLTHETDEKAKLVLNLYMSATTPEVVSVGDSASPINEIIHPEEPAVVASTESSVKKVVKYKKPVVAKPVGDAGLDVITHEE